MTMYQDPFGYMGKMQEEMEDAFDRFFGRPYRRPMLPGKGDEKTGGQLAIREPLLDIVDEKGHYKVILEIPGINKDDIEINVTENTLTISARLKHEEKKEGKGYFYQERRYGSFQRNISLPGEVLPEETDAEYRKGVLEVKLKKKHEAKTRQHKVKVK